jgi:hypothetical protein
MVPGMHDPFADLESLAFRPTGSELAAEKERAERKRREEAFWNRPEDEVQRDLVIPEEDLPARYRGGPHRWFRSANIVDLIRAKPTQKKKHGQ